MNAEQYEILAANWVRNFAKARAAHNCDKRDESAATAAILCRALELATPDLSPAGRARLFMEDDE
jgi:hypothetical protein